MRLKAIPIEVESFASKHALALTIGAAIVVGGYVYIRNHQSPSDNQDANAVASTSLPFTYAMPQIVPAGGGGSTGLVETVSNPNVPSSSVGAGTDNASGSGGNSLDWAMFNLEVTKQANDFQLASRALDAQIAIAKANTDVAMAGINATNYQTSAMLAESFLQSGSMFFTGSVGGQTFSFLQSPQVYSGKNMTQVNAQQNALFQQLLGSFSSGQSSTGTISVSPYGSTSTTPSVFTSGSASYPTADYSSVSSSPQSATNDNSYTGSFSTRTLSGGVTRTAYQ